MKMLLTFLLLAIPITVFGGENPSSNVASLSKDEVLRLGEAMYHRGILPSGEKMKGIVQGDIEMDGTMFTCSDCHLKSGIGSYEGTVLSPPIDAKSLFGPFQDFSKIPSWVSPASRRPAYTDKTLAEALRTGFDSAGNRLADTMPIYSLDDRDMDILILYLRNLSAEISPGITDTTLRFATVVTEGVSQEDKEAMLAPLKAYVLSRNARAYLYETRRRRQIPKQMDLAYRLLELDVWELKGPREDWPVQLEAFYEKKPVFALLGGIAEGNWEPIHRFCEAKKIPALFPITDLPVVSESDWYTYYFSKGFYQEGETVAKYMKKNSSLDLPGKMRVVQVYRPGPEGDALARGFQREWEKAEMSPVESLRVKAGEPLTGEFWRKLSAEYGKAVFLLWLPPEDLASVSDLAAGEEKPDQIFMSATFLGKKLYSLPEDVKDFTLIAYPYRLTPEPAATFTVEPLLKRYNMKSSNLIISSRMLFMTRVLSQILMHMRIYFYRDYFLDVVGMLEDETYTSADYPRLSFGPGQRYASKGCYIVQLGHGKNAGLTKKSEWVIY